MCLTKITKRYKSSEKVSGTGWKVFEMSRGRLYRDFQGLSIPRPKGKWLHERKFRAFAWMRNIEVKDSYSTGWHIFSLRKAAEKYARERHPFHGSIKMVVKKVRYRRAIVLGLQPCSVTDSKPIYRCIVAKEIFIL